MVVGVTSDLIRGDIYYWGSLMAGAVMASLMVGLIMELTPRIKDLAGMIGGSEIASKFDGVEAWKALSMYLLVILVVTFRSRGFFGKKSVLDA